MKIGFIGNLGNRDSIGGQITKTRELLAYLFEYSENSNIAAEIRGGCSDNVFDQGWIDVLDVSRTNNIYTAIVHLLKIFRSCDHIIVILASTGYFKLLPFMYVINLVFKRNVYEIAIGGIRHEFLNRMNKIFEKKISAIYVETTYMVERYHEAGLNNVFYMPNFKKMYRNCIPQKSDSELKICTFSRIDEYKGIDTAIQVMQKLEDRRDISLDIVGPVKEEYKDAFNELLSQSSSNVNYCGSVGRDEINDFLGKYDVLLFPTKWKTEGFPGIFLDAFENGIIVLATDLPAFRDAIKNDNNGMLFPINGIEEYVRYINELADDVSKRERMRLASFESARIFESESALGTLVEKIFN